MVRGLLLAQTLSTFLPLVYRREMVCQKGRDFDDPDIRFQNSFLVSDPMLSRRYRVLSEQEGMQYSRFAQ